MDKLWAPWRIKYIETAAKKSRGKCLFCGCAKGRGNGQVILKTRYSIAILNIFPYNNGHILISPLRHVQKISQLKDAEVLDLFRALNRVNRLLDKVLKPDGYNIGVNIGRVAGAGIPGHLHLHIVPRWNGDTNFMPVINDTKIISQSLDELYKRLKSADAKTD